MAAETKEEYWSRFQTSYDKNQEYVVGKDLLNELKENIMILPDLGEVLELGCGTGYFTETVALNADHVFATDLSDELLEIAREQIKKPAKITIQKENCMNTSFAPKQFDTVFMANLIHVIEKPSKVLQECYRLLKNDGLLIIASFTNYGMKPLGKIKLGIRFIRAWGKPPKFTHRFSPDSLNSLVKAAGFSIRESKIIGRKTRSLFLICKKNNE